MKNKHTILIAEDSAIQSKKLEDLFIISGFEVLSANNGVEAMSIIDSNKPDLIISDIIMPEMDGYDLCRKIKQTPSLSSIPVILLSTMNSPKDIMMGVESGVDYYLTKPYDDDYLISKIRAILHIEIGMDQELHLDDQYLNKSYNPRKLINLLACTYENSLLINKRLIKSRAEVRELNLSLEKKIRERTALLEQEISEREKNEGILKAVIEDAPAMICRFRPDGTITFVNHHFARIFKKNGSRLIGKNFFNLIGNKELGLKKIAESLNDEIQVKAFGYSIDSKEGFVTYLECYIRALFDKHGQISEYQTIAMDVTEQTKARADKEKLEKHITQVKTMETIGKLASGIAHDFNNILSPLMVNTEMALSISEENTEIYHHLEEIMKAAVKSRDLIRSILTLGKMKSLEHTLIKLQAIILESVSLLKSSIPSNIEILQNLDMTCSPFIGDATQIQRVIVNLCTNACHAMRENGGTLEIALSEKTLPDDFHIKTEPDKKGKYLHLRISDTGCGIPPEILPRIFEPFFTTKKIGEGTGLGLSSVKGIIKSHQGDILVDSSAGKGSSFHIFIPVARGMKKSIDKKKDNILLVDDDVSVLDSVSKILEANGYRVSAFSNSVEALTAFNENNANFDLLMTDFAMPGITGIELSRKIRECRPDLPVLIFTGFKDEISNFPDKAEYLIKPITTHEMTSKIKDLLSSKYRHETPNSSTSS